MRELGAALETPRPRELPRWMRMAAVAVIFREAPAGLELLFVRRRVRPGRRWSGDVAFPGGLAERHETPEATARREAREEVGLDLGACLGRLSAQLTLEPRRARPMRVVPVVFVVEGDPPLACEPREIAQAFWVPWSSIARARTRWIRRSVGPLPLLAPSLPVAGHPLWGLTLQMTRELRRRLRSR